MSKIIYKGIGYAASILPFIGTDGTDPGVTGLVPAPSTSDMNKFLKSDGTWGIPTGGSGGTSDYEELINLPSINNHILLGNMSLSQLGLIDCIYPTGSCYETQDSNFDPNTEWGGTWEQLDSTFTIVGGMERFDVSGSGGVTIKAAWGSFPTLSKNGTYKMEIECYSSTTSYTITATLGNQTIGTVSATNGSLHSFINNINGTSGQALGLSITTVNTNTHIRVTLHQKDNTYRWHRTA